MGRRRLLGCACYTNVPGLEHGVVSAQGKAKAAILERKDAG